MSYFNYHAKIINLIKNKKILSYSFVDSYKSISPALLFFDLEKKVYPIREYRFEEYLIIIDKYKLKKVNYHD